MKSVLYFIYKLLFCNFNANVLDKTSNDSKETKCSQTECSRPEKKFVPTPLHKCKTTKRRVNIPLKNPFSPWTIFSRKIWINMILINIYFLSWTTCIANSFFEFSRRLLANKLWCTTQNWCPTMLKRNSPHMTSFADETGHHLPRSGIG